MRTIKLLTDDGDRRAFRIEDDGPLANGFKARPGKVAYCEFVIYRSYNDPRGLYLSTYGGEVWPGAWPDLFESLKGTVHTGPITRLTAAGMDAIDAATAAGRQ